jgi:hypothetical protein
MNLESEREFHLRRARQELDLAYRTSCRIAIESHLRLSSLHMAQLRGSAPGNGETSRLQGPRILREPVPVG